MSSEKATVLDTVNTNFCCYSLGKICFIFQVDFIVIFFVLERINIKQVILTTAIKIYPQNKSNTTFGTEAVNRIIIKSELTASTKVAFDARLIRSDDRDVYLILRNEKP